MEVTAIIFLTTTTRVAVLRVVVLPCTVKSPVTVRLFEIVTLDGKLIVTAPTPEFDTAISFAVPVRPVTRVVALSEICDEVIEIVEFAAAVKRP